MAPDVLSRFEEDGVAALRGAFGSDEAAFLRDQLWRHIEANTTVRLNDQSTWNFDGHLGLRAVEERAIWHPIHASRAVVGALNDIFGVDGWTPPGAPHLLLTFPEPGPWRMRPGQWHIDFGFDQPTWPVYAVKLFALLDSVEPAGGGTLLLKGSHRLADRFEAAGGRRAPGAETELLESDPYLRTLHANGGGRDLLGETVEVHGVPISPVEITGEAGDVFLTHMQVFHCPSPNTADLPRQMLGSTVARKSPADPPPLR